MQVVISKLLKEKKEKAKQLVETLSKEFAYVSVLATDSKGTAFAVRKKSIFVADSFLCTECGYVVRVHNGIGYSEYSFNAIEDTSSIVSKMKEIAKDIDLKVSHDSKAHDPWLYESEDTTHYSIADKEGNMVAITKTVNGLFGNSVVVDGYGFVMNNEMDDFVLGAGHPNSVAPSKTPLSSMSPTIVLKDGKPFMVLGSPGATKIISTVSQVISRVIDHKMGMQDAIDAPRLWDNTSNKINVETRIPDETLKQLEAMGHKTNKTSEWDRGMGSVQGVLYKADGTLEGGADPRRDGKALGF